MTAGPSTRRGDRPEASTRATLAVGGLAVACYANTLANGFVFDDLLNILANPWIANMRSLREIFSSHVVGFDPSLPAVYYRPFVNVVYLAIHLVFGAKSAAFHAVNVALHVVASMLAYVVSVGVFTRLAPGTALGRGAGTAAFLAAAIFAMHPVHTESVAWIAGITDVASTAFLFLAYVAYVAHAGTRGGWSATPIGGAAALLAAALFKETALLLLVFVVLDDVLRRRAESTADAFATPRKIVPYVAAAAVYLAARAWALGRLVPELRGPALDARPAAATVADLFARYLGTLAWPHPLNALHTLDPPPGLASPRAIAGLAVAAGFVATLVAARRRPVLVLAGAMIAVPLLPALYLHATGEAAFAERYLYLPVLGFGWVVAWAGTEIAARGRRWAGACRAVAVALLCAYAVATVARNQVWRDGLSLWSDTVAKSPGSAVAHEFLCLAQSEAARWPDALVTCRHSVELDAGRIHARVALGQALSVAGRFDHAIVEFRATLDRSPDVPEALRGLAVACASSGQPELAVAPLVRAVAVRPGFAEAHNDLGVLLGRLGRTDEAVANLREAVRLQPDNALFGRNLERFAEAVAGPGGR